MHRLLSHSSPGEGGQLTIQPHILGKRRADDRLQAQLVDEITDGERIIRIAPRRDAQICRIE